MEHRIVAIMALDGVDFTRIMGIDRMAALARHKAHRREHFDRKVAEHGGQLLKDTGDGFFAEFADAVDAVLCAADIQRAMPRRNIEVPEPQRLAYRIGIDLGELVIEGSDIHGDGVSVASSLEKLAEPHGIAVSDAVFVQVVRKVELGFEQLGQRKVKGIAEPVTVYRVMLDRSGEGKITAGRRMLSTPWRTWIPLGLAAVIVVVVAFWFYS